jgi:hypothetical protein
MKTKRRNERTHERKPLRQTKEVPKTAVRKRTPVIKRQVVPGKTPSIATILAERIASTF